MGYSIFRFGALYLKDKIQHFPQKPKENGDIPQYMQRPKISIGVEGKEEPIAWIKPNGMNIFIADRILLGNVSWKQLKHEGFVTGKKITINGQRFLCRLPHLKNIDGGPIEWHEILKESDDADSTWHWKRAYFWGAEAWDGEAVAAFCGYHNPRFIHHTTTTYASEYLGFRLVLEPLGYSGPFRSIKLDGVNFQLSSISGGEGYCPILKPVSKNVFADIPDGSQVKMYSLSERGKPVHFWELGKDVAKLELTDHYFGDEYLLPWTISNGIAVAERENFASASNTLMEPMQDSILYFLEILHIKYIR